jgi:hypothetical protein
LPEVRREPQVYDAQLPYDDDLQEPAAGHSRTLARGSLRVALTNIRREFNWSGRMATAISFLALAICVALGALIAFVVALAAMRLHSSPAVLPGSRIGGLAMLLPSFRIAIFTVGPLGGGMLIGMVGEPGA